MSATPSFHVNQGGFTKEEFVSEMTKIYEAQVADLSDEALFHLLILREFGMVGKVAERPHDDACREDGGAHFLQILFALLPGVTAHALDGGHTVRGQFHHERSAFSPHDETAEHLCHEDAEEDADEIDAEENEGRILGEEGADDDDIDGQSG